ncbi:response regulator [Thioclava atlantica]|uniref:Response regulator receiver protein n=1 Tax=Thioclava atlantica TaxID=1317124 RepID=A0A085U1A5_9RHOB|nr:response regulator [Thioclava atlantica]KFE36752.1 response regulator receiver protein [Thioclava atlantica]
MTDEILPVPQPKATPERPLIGLTILLVEDSRFASEAVRLLCLRSGARIRRADCLRSAYRHLQTYRPDVVIVDMGLPDGSGSDLIAQILGRGGARPALLGTSGDSGLRAAAVEAGADGFLEKPVESLSQFQQAILAVLPAEKRPQGLRLLRDTKIAPDPLALCEDLERIAEVLRNAPAGRTLPYAAHFLAGIALSAHDGDLRKAALRLGRAGGPSQQEMSEVTGLIAARLTAGGAI